VRITLSGIRSLIRGGVEEMNEVNKNIIPVILILCCVLSFSAGYFLSSPNTIELCGSVLKLPDGEIDCYPPECGNTCCRYYKDTIQGLVMGSNPGCGWSCEVKK